LTGIQIINTLPSFSFEVKLIVPLCISIIFFEIESPSPVPMPAFLEVNPAVKIFF